MLVLLLFTISGCGKDSSTAPVLAGTWKRTYQASGGTTSDTHVFGQGGTYDERYSIDGQPDKDIEWSGTYTASGSEITKTITTTVKGLPYVGQCPKYTYRFDSETSLVLTCDSETLTYTKQ
jgi:hypothetical protein